MRRDLKKQVHRVWLAGLGAAMAAERGGGELFSRLVQEGERLEQAAGLSEEHEILVDTVFLLERIVEERVRTREMIESMMPSTFPTAPAVLQARRNAAARTALLEEFGGLSSLEVADLAGSRASNRAALANRWKQEGRIFGVVFQGETCFPSFQFDAQGRPHEVIARIIEALGKDQTEWQLALWFTAANGWLDGRRPVDLLESEPNAVIEAAKQAGSGLDF